MKKAPWTDFKGGSIFEGDIIAHPSGQRGRVIFKDDETESCDQWRVVYGLEDVARLCLQIGEKGQAVVVEHSTDLRNALLIAADGSIQTVEVDNFRCPPPILNGRVDGKADPVAFQFVGYGPAWVNGGQEPLYVQGDLKMQEKEALFSGYIHSTIPPPLEVLHFVPNVPPPDYLDAFGHLPIAPDR